MATKKKFLGNNGLDANNLTISNVATPSASSDASTKGYADTLVPSQAGNSGKYLTTNGSATSWATVTASASAESLTGTTIASTVTGSSLTSVGTITTGTWNASAIGVAYGGTGLTTLTAGYIPYGNGTSAFGSSANLFWDSTNSRLGVGTSSPTAKITVSGTGTGSAIDFTNTTASTGRSYRWVSINSGGFAIEDISASGAERMRITSSGSVGIGIASPAQKLDINGKLRFTPNTADTNYSADIYANYDSAHPFQLDVKNNGSTAEYLGVYADGGGSNNRVVFPTGNVGIGITSPSYKLDVSGTFNASGAITQNGSQVLTASNLLNYAQSTTEWYHSNRDFVNGTLITTSIDYSVTNGDPFILEIRGNSYGNLIPFSIQIQGYIYNNTIINYGGYSIGGAFNIIAMNVGGNLCFWFARQAYWQGFNVKAYTALPTRALNKVTSITDVVEPTAGTKKVTITPTQVLRSDNYSSYALPLSGGTISGNLSVTGTLNASSTLSQGGNQVLHAGNYSSYALPLSGGVVTGSTYYRKNQTDGNYGTASLWTESYGNTTTGIAFHISGVVGKFLEMRTNGTLYFDNNTMIHSGNYSSYAVPTGDVSVSNVADKIVKRDGNGHIYVTYVFSSYLNQSGGNSENPTIGQIWTQNTTDNYCRKSTPAHFKNQMGMYHNDGTSTANRIIISTSTPSGTITDGDVWLQY